MLRSRAWRRSIDATAKGASAVSTRSGPRLLSAEAAATGRQLAQAVPAESLLCSASQSPTRDASRQWSRGARCFIPVMALPETAHRILTELLVWGGDRETVLDRLADEHAIERVPMKIR